MISITSIFLSIIIYIVYTYIVHPIFLSPLSKVPSAHPLAPVTSLWLSHIRRKGILNHTIHSLHLKHGPVVRIAPNYISANTPSALRTIYSSGGGFEKDRWYSDLFSNYGVLNMVTMQDSKAHSVQKRMMAHVYSKSYLQKSDDLAMISKVVVYDRLLPFLSSIQATEKDMIEKGQEQKEEAPGDDNRNKKKKGSVDVLSLFQAVGFDFTSAFFVGLQHGSNFVGDRQSHEKWQSWYAKFKTQDPKARSLGEVESWCLKMCEAAFKELQGKEKEKEKEKNLEPADHNAKPEIYPSSTTKTELPKTETGRNTGGPGSSPASPPKTNPIAFSSLTTGLSQLLPLPTSPSPSPSPSLPFTSTPRWRLIASEMLDQLLAGGDSSAITLTYLFYELSKRPDLQSQLRSELDTLPQKLTTFPPLHPTTSPSSSSSSSSFSLSSSPVLPTPASIDALPLLDATLTETLRLYSAAPSLQPRVTPRTETPIRIEGFVIPSGTVIASSAWTLHRNRDVFPDPDSWIPERWLPSPSPLPSLLDQQQQQRPRNASSARNKREEEEKEEEKEKEETLKKERRKWFWPFGSGGRMCIGNHFALQELKLVTAAVHSNFRTWVVDDEGIEQEDGFIPGPKGGKLILGFERINYCNKMMQE